jgi:hypothetical protein
LTVDTPTGGLAGRDSLTISHPLYAWLRQGDDLCFDVVCLSVLNEMRAIRCALI